jgi:hypothetical protein
MGASPWWINPHHCSPADKEQLLGANMGIAQRQNGNCTAVG